MILFGKDLARDVLVVAEIGVNHEGDIDAASRLLREAAAAGADAVKFQTYTPARFIAAADAERLARVGRFDLGAAGFRRLRAEADALGVGFFSTPVSDDVVPLLDELCPVFKIASGDVTFEPVIRAAARTGKPLLLSTGVATVEEIDRAVGWIADTVGEAALADRLVLMHCVSAYPTPVNEANIRAVPFLAARYGVPVGWSHHCLEPEPCLAAVALGASVIEVHFTDRKEGRSFRDHQLSFEPADLRRLADSVAVVRACLGRAGKTPQPCEIGVRDAIRKGVVAARALPEGHALAAADLMYARPATAIPAAALPDLAGRRLTRALGPGESVARDGVAPAWVPDGR